MSSLIRNRVLDLMRQCDKKSPYIADTIIAAVTWVLAAALILQRPEFSWRSLLCAFAMSAALVWRRQVPAGVAIVTGVLLWMDAVLAQTMSLPLAGLIAVGTVAALSSLWQRVAMHVGALVVISVVWLVTDVAAIQVWLTAFAYIGAYGWGRLWFGQKKVEALLRANEDMAVQRDLAVAERSRAAGRARLAVDMHDLASQPLDLLVIQADAGHGLVSSDPDGAGQSFDSIARLGRRASAQLQRNRQLLSDAARQDGAVVEPTLHDLGQLVEHVEAAGLEVTLETQGIDHGAQSLSSGAQTVIYRVVQESLAAVLRGSEAGEVNVNVDCTDEHVAVTVTDSGDRKAKPRPSSGGGELASLRRRAAVYDGTIDVEPPAATHGARWRVVFPLAKSRSTTAA